MKKLLIIFLIMTFTMSAVNAKNVKNNISSLIKSSGASKDSVAISVRNLRNGKLVSSVNGNILMNPASVQKALTMPAAVDRLGSDYVFKTSVYSRGDSDYIIKLSGDPFLRTSELKTIVSPIKPDTKTVYIDSSVLDNNTWGEGWQWDDDLNVLMPRFGAFNLDKNLIKINIIPSENNLPAKITIPSKYPFLINNNLKTSGTTSYEIKRDLSVNMNGLSLNGTIAKPVTIYIPSNNIERYFELQLTRTLENRKVYLKTPFVKSHVNSSDKYITSIEHPLIMALNEILKNSNNTAAETVFKLAGNGTAQGGVKMFSEYCTKNNIDPSGIKITDGSGVSKNNLVSADFVSDFLYVNKENETLKLLPSPGEGTLTQRMLPIKNNLRAKTGTLSGVSAIAGYLTSKSGNKYCFCIMQNDTKLSESDKKMLEDYIIKTLYLKG